MKILVAILNDSNLYPSPYYIASALAADGHDVTFLSRVEPSIQLPSQHLQPPKWLALRPASVLEGRLPFIRGNYHRVLAAIARIKPDIFIGQHQLAMIGAFYGLFSRHIKVMPYFCDHMVNMWYSKPMRRLARRYAGYLDICDLRVNWRKAEWPDLRCPAFVIRQAPPLDNNKNLIPHAGKGRVVFTGSDYGPDMQWDLLSRFARALVSDGIDFDWYMPGAPEKREKARAISGSPHFRVLEPVTKAKLLTLLGEYDAGLLWAPVRVEGGHTPRTVFEHYFLSAASNKICEYHAAGLVTLHTGNPGLAYLPAGVSQAVDPWEPEVSARRIAMYLAQRHSVEEGRRAAFAYYQQTMNAEAQAEPFIRYIRSLEAMRSGAAGSHA